MCAGILGPGLSHGICAQSSRAEHQPKDHGRRYQGARAIVYQFTHLSIDTARGRQVVNPFSDSCLP